MIERILQFEVVVGALIVGLIVGFAAAVLLANWLADRKDRF